MSKLRKSARGETCAVRIPRICNFNPETTVLAHAPCVDKGTGYKSPDWWGMYACSNCHDVIDHRAKRGDIDAELLRKYIMDAIYETQKRMIDKGLIKIA